MSAFLISIFTARCTSALRGIEIACRPSVCLSVCLWRSCLVDQDHKGWKSWKLSTRKISPTPSLFVGQKPSTYSQGNMGKLGETRGGVGKSGVLEHKSGNISETVKIWKSYYGEPIGIHKRSFEQYHPRPPTAFPSSRLGVRNPTPKLQSLLSQERVKLQLPALYAHS